MKKGFTLIELLAVIVILAIIALISVPIILNVVEKSRRGASESSALGYTDAVNNLVIVNELDSKKTPVTDGTYTVDELKTLGIEVKGTKPTSGTVIISGRYVTEATLCINNYSIKYENSKAKITDEENYCNSGNEEKLTGTEIGQVTQKLLDVTDTYQYMDGIYLKGNPTNNYLWYNGFVWRVMGKNKDGSIRLITAANVTSISKSAPNNSLNYASDEGYIKDWLNNYFYGNLNNTKNIIEEGAYFCGELTTNLASVRTNCQEDNLITGKVGLISIDEYNLSGTKNSYLNIKQNQTTITPYSEIKTMSTTDLGAVGTGYTQHMCSYRPVINVKSNTLVTRGDGTPDNLYVLGENKSSDITGKIGEKVTSGEYVNLENRTYRVVSKNKEGVKLILDGYYEETKNVAYRMVFNETTGNNTFTLDSGIGQKLNGDVLNWLGLGSSNKIIETKWYQTDGFSTGTKYTDVLAETGEVISKVGLIRVGEMLSSQSSTVITKNYTVSDGYAVSQNYWTMSKHTTDTSIWVGAQGGTVSNSSINSSIIAVRPVIVVRNNLTISGGTGIWNNPYQI